MLLEAQNPIVRISDSDDVTLRILPPPVLLVDTIPVNH